MPRPSHDAVLVALVRRGSAAAYERLFRRFWRVAWQAAHAVTLDAALADDVAQEAMERVLGSLDRLDEGRPLGPWVRRIAARRGAARLRRREPALLPVGDERRALAGGGVVAGAPGPSFESELVVARSHLHRYRERAQRGFGPWHEGVYVNSRTCTPSRARVPLSQAGLPGPPFAHPTGGVLRGAGADPRPDPGDPRGAGALAGPPGAVRRGACEPDRDGGRGPSRADRAAGRLRHRTAWGVAALASGLTSLPVM
jgi:hypothetical protein